MTAVTPGDFGVVRTGDWTGAVIRHVTRSEWNHALVAVTPFVAVEARPSGAGTVLLSAYRNIAWYKAPDGKGPEIADRARGLVGVPYGWPDILSVGLLQYHIKPHLLRAFVADENRLICSQLVDLAYSQAGVHLFDDGRWPGDVTPGDLGRLITPPPKGTP
jgi:hypothetical protein